MKKRLIRYQERATNYAASAAALKSRYNYFSIIRLVAFFAGIFLAIFIFTQLNVWIGMVFLVLFLIGFARFVFWHKAILTKSKHHQYLATINKEEVDVLNHEYHHFDNGDLFVDPAHPYSVDLDIFGDYSVFQYFNRTSTSIGRQSLATYLTQIPAKTEIFNRQAAVQELQNQLDWRQNLQAYGRDSIDNPEHLRLLHLWLSDEPFVSNNRWLQLALYLVPIWMIIGIGLSIYFLSWKLIILFIILPAAILSRNASKVNDTHTRTTHAAKMLSSYAKLMQHIEPASFQSTKLNELQAKLNSAKTPASKAIGQISHIINQLNVRYNVFAALLNLTGLWELQWVSKLERWKAINKDHLPEWFVALQEFEALNSLATTYYNNPDWQFPVIHESDHLLGDAMGHPLIHRDKRITNDFKSPTKAHIKLVTGSNMAGKSTFLRTVGTNIVLAMTGAPVCATSLQLPMLQVYTSMRTQDALHESTSSFYAELKRLKIIIEAVEKGENIYFLMDEILKGTNSKDRHTGSRALIQQMIKSRGAGIIATHDLELGNMEASANGAIENLCMEVAVDNGALRFDYKLEKGVSKSFNATILMKEMGIAIEEEG